MGVWVVEGESYGMGGGGNVEALGGSDGGIRLVKLFVTKSED